MEEEWLNKKIIERKPKAFRQTGDAKMKWKYKVKQDLEVNKIYHWKRQAKIENEWNWIIEQAKFI